MSILLIGLNHTTAPVELRERLYFSGAPLADLLGTLQGLPGVEEAVALCTCNRSEFLTAGDDVRDAVMALLAEQAQVDLPTLISHLYCYEGRTAIEHLFRVACGLDSLVIGETQILKQVRDALDAACRQGTAGGQLIGLVQQAVAVGKRARSQTGISQGSFSIGHAGVEFARNLFPNLSQSPVLILGAGKISELTVRHLAAQGVQSIIVANRTHAHAVELAERLQGRAIHYHELEDALATVDILISSTGAPHLILHAETVARTMSRRNQRPLCLIDLAVPRDVDPAAGAIPQVHLFNIDDLQEVAERANASRRAAVPEVEAIIAEAVERCCCRRAGQELGAVIAAMRHAFEDVRQSELDRLRPLLASLTPEQQAAIEAMTASMVNKMLHEPTVRLKAMAVANPDSQPHEVLSELFGLCIDEEAVP
jgi:glutamyl-tRNA reductase